MKNKFTLLTGLSFLLFQCALAQTQSDTLQISTQVPDTVTVCGDSVDNTNPNAPVFFIDSIAGNGFASITLSAFANCDFVDSIAFLLHNNKNPTI